MICNLFNFCPQSAQSRRHGGLWWAEPPNKAPSPPNWNMKHYKSVEFLSIFRISSPPRRTNTESAACSSFIHKKPNLTQTKQEFKYLVVWPAQNFRWAKMFDLRRATVFWFRYCLLKHKMTRYSKIWRAMAPCPRPGYAYVCAVYITHM